MHLWISSSSQDFTPQLSIEFKKDFPDFSLKVDRFVPADFLTALDQRRSDGSSPDVAFIDNYTQLKPLIDRKAVWIGWEEVRFRTSGWWVIFKDGKQVERAQAFFRWLSRSPHWLPMRVTNTSISVEQIGSVQKVAIDAVNDDVAGKDNELSALMLANAARYRLWPPDATFKLIDTKPILTFGNGQTAFVILATVGSSDEVYGMRHQAMILRNHGGNWRILFLHPNVPLNWAEDLFRSFDAKITTAPTETMPPKAILVSPPDKAKLPRSPTLPEIQWTVASGDRLSFLVESQFSYEGNWEPSKLGFAEIQKKTQPLTVTAPFGVGAQPHRWRIWVLNPDGGISVSDWREIYFTN